MDYYSAKFKISKLWGFEWEEEGPYQTFSKLLERTKSKQIIIITTI